MKTAALPLAPSATYTRLSAQIDQLSASAPEPAAEIAELRVRVNEPERKFDELKYRYRRSVRMWSGSPQWTARRPGWSLAGWCGIGCHAGRWDSMVRISLISSARVVASTGLTR
jgi:hypothetical protein